MTRAGWPPPVDIAEDSEKEKTSHQGGVRRRSRRMHVNVKILEGVLPTTGERKFEKEEKGKKYHRVERAYASSARSFSLPRR